MKDVKIQQGFRLERNPRYKIDRGRLLVSY